MTDLFSMQNIIHGDCLDVMREMDPCSIDCIVTDPPYGLSFMGKDWDHGVPGIEFWKASLRVLKPGGHLLAFGGTRTYHRLTCAIEDAGFEIRDCMMWVFGSGFPKSHNFGKKVGGGWEGYGTALKPAYEPIIVAMRSIDGTFAQNAEKWGVGGINIDECRVATSDNWKILDNGVESIMWRKKKPITRSSNILGRWPANIILDEEAGMALDEQSGEGKSSGPRCSKIPDKFFIGKGMNPTVGYFDSGGASRFFYCAKASSAERNNGLEGLNKKAAFDNENGAMGGNMGSRYKPRENHHPTVKPIKLMEYLLKLVMPPFPDAVVLDPFAGSGSTLVAAKNLGFNAIGIEKEAEYVEIANRRIA